MTIEKFEAEVLKIINKPFYVIIESAYKEKEVKVVCDAYKNEVFKSTSTHYESVFKAILAQMIGYYKSYNKEMRNES